MKHKRKIFTGNSRKKEVTEKSPPMKIKLFFSIQLYQKLNCTFDDNSFALIRYLVIRLFLIYTVHLINGLEHDMHVHVSFNQ